MKNKNEAMFANQRYLELDDDGLFAGTDARKPVMPIIFVLDELDAMMADLEQMRAGTWKPMMGIATALPGDDLDAIESEWIGHEVSTTWGLP